MYYLIDKNHNNLDLELNQKFEMGMRGVESSLSIYICFDFICE